MTSYIGDGKSNDRPVSAKVAVCEKSPYQGEHVAGHLEIGLDGIRFPGRVMKGTCQVKRQNGAHSVIGAALSEFAPKNEPQGRWVACLFSPYPFWCLYGGFGDLGTHFN